MTHDTRTVVDRLGEGLARRVARRQFLKKASAAVFGVVAVWAVEGFQVPGARAGQCYTTEAEYGCSPPYGRYCLNLSSQYCVGSDCNSPYCTPAFDFGYPTACWCTLESCDGTYLGYYVCCDCYCGGTACGCYQFVRTALC